MVTKQQLIDLIQEIVDDEPISHDGDKGNVCPFCFSEKHYHLYMNLGIQHSESCWISRARKLLSEIKQ